MSALAEAIGLSPASVSAYESGLRTPTAETLSALASALKHPVSYFTKERKFPIQAKGAVFFRSLVSARTRREQELRMEHANRTYEVFAWLNQYVELPAANIPELTSGQEDWTERESEIEEVAYKLRECWGLTMGPISNLVTLLENNGVFVVRQLSGNKQLDAFSRTVNGRPIIFLGADKGSAVRSRFDAAHELGHLVLHPHISQEDMAEKEVLERIEREANQFAAAFLLPEMSFARELTGVTMGAFITLKKRWRVAIQAMIRRAEGLGALDYDQYKRLQIQISARGMRTREPLDDEIAPEMPSIPRAAWEIIWGNRSMGRPSICEDLDLPQQFLAETLGVPPEQILPLDEQNKIIPIRLGPSRTDHSDLRMTFLSGE